MKHSKIVFVSALALLVAGAMPAHAGKKKVNDYVRSSDGSLVRDSEGKCVRSSNKTTKLLEECGYKAKKVAKKKPKMMPAPAIPKDTVIESIVVNNIQFNFDSAELHDADKAQLDNVSSRMGAHKSSLASGSSRATITGYTDTSGSEAYNMKLSERRANAVADYVASKSGIDRGMFKVSGAGEANPVADNSTRDGRIRNRRVEIDVIKN